MTKGEGMGLPLAFGDGKTLHSPEEIEADRLSTEQAKSHAQSVDEFMKLIDDTCAYVRRQTAPGQSYGSGKPVIDEVRAKMRQRLLVGRHAQNVDEIMDFFRSWFGDQVEVDRAARERARAASEVRPASPPPNYCMPKG